MQLYICITIYPCGYSIFPYSWACGGIGFHLLFFLISKIKTFLGWNACIYLALIACYIFIAVYLIWEELFSPHDVSGRNLIFHFCHYKCLTWLREKVLGQKRDERTLRTASCFWKLFYISRKKYFEATLFSMDYKLWSHNTLKSFLHSYLHWNLDFL